MPTIYEALRADHDRQRRLMAALLETTGDSPERRELFATLRSELDAHAAAEERHFYVALLQHDLTQGKARHSVAEHKDLDDVVEQLEDYDMSGSQWLQTARDLAHELEHHLAEEEHEVFQLAGKVLGDEESVALAGAYDASMAKRRDDD